MKNIIYFTAAALLAFSVNTNCSKGNDTNCSKGNDSPGHVSISVASLTFNGAGESKQFTLSADSDWEIYAPEWLDISPNSGKGDGMEIYVTATAAENITGYRSGKITVALRKGKICEISAKQEISENTLNSKKFAICANSMVYYGGCVEFGSQGETDYGMFSKLLSANGYTNFDVTDCVYGGHHLYDYTSKGCKTSGGGCPGVGKDLLGSLDLSSYDYVIAAESGNNNTNFYTDVMAVYERFRAANPKVKLVYINHVYTVYKKHTNILNNLQKLHEDEGVIIVNCGQLAYDIYTGAVKVPGGSITYSDRYTFCNHNGSDTYHPNPLMGYIMSQMLYCALSGQSAENADYLELVKSCNFGKAVVAYSEYSSKYYPTAAAVPFETVLENEAEMQGIQQLIPSYINKY